ncbi:MAG: OPT/YSL family transporter [Planctomycetota bacterium]
MKKDVLPVVFGVVVSTVLAGTLVIAGLKAGITPGVSPLVILVAWGVFRKASAGGGGSRFLNLTQVAGSAGMAVTAGVIFVAPLVQILYSSKGLDSPPVDVVNLIVLSIAGAFIGFGFVGLTVKKFLSDPTLPAPEARACETMIKAAISEKDTRPKMGRSLYAGLLAGAVGPLVTALGLAGSKVKIFERVQEGGDRSALVGLPFSPIYIGIGGLLTLATGLLVFGGSLLRLIGDWILAGVPVGSEMAATLPENSMRWVGGGAMTVAVAWSLIRFFRVRLPIGGEEEDRLIDVDPDRRRRQMYSVLFGFAILLVWLATSGAAAGFAITISVTTIVMCMLMVALGAILSLQIGSSASPVSGTIFVTTLVLCLAALFTGHNRIEDVLILTPILVAACVAVCTANDSSQDYKTLQLCGVRVQDGFLAQILGLLGACVVVPVVLYVAHEAYTLGSDDLAAPQGQMFATLIDGLLLNENLPWTPIFVGLGIGGLAVLADILGGKRGIQLPAMALAVGIYLPAYIGIGILIGAIARRLAEGPRTPQTNESILTAAGLITGAATLELVFGILILGVSGFTPEGLNLFAENPLPAAVPMIGAAIGIAVLAWLIFVNSKPRESGSTEA